MVGKEVVLERLKMRSDINNSFSQTSPCGSALCEGGDWSIPR